MSGKERPMKRVFELLALLLALLPASTWADKTFDLQVDLNVGGSQISVPMVRVQEGNKTVIGLGGDRNVNFVEVLATEQKNETGPSNVSLEMVVGYMNTQGERIILSRPTISTMLDHKAEVKVGAQDGRDEFSLSVKASEVR